MTVKVTKIKDDEHKVCPYCGRSITPDQDICYKCKLDIEKIKKALEGLSK